jgi:GST-like protein
MRNDLGLKVAIMMEELHERLTLKGKTFHYEDHELNLSALETRKLDYLRLCPNGKIPMIIDRTPDNQTITVWESGAILLYLGEKYHEMVPMENIYDRAEALKWLFWASASLSPQAKAFGFYYTHCPQTLPYCINRYAKEVDRLLGVLEMQLKHGHHWIVGGIVGNSVIGH